MRIVDAAGKLLVKDMQLNYWNRVTEITINEGKRSANHVHAPKKEYGNWVVSKGSLGHACRTFTFYWVSALYPAKGYGASAAVDL